VSLELFYVFLLFLFVFYIIMQVATASLNNMYSLASFLAR